MNALCDQDAFPSPIDHDHWPVIHDCDGSRSDWSVDQLGVGEHQWRAGEPFHARDQLNPRWALRRLRVGGRQPGDSGHQKPPGHLPSQHPGAGTTTRITNTSVGGPPNGGSESPVISEDGRYIGFASRATNFVGQQTTGYNAYVYDTQTGDYTLASVNNAGDAANAGGGTQVGMSPDGRYVVFATKASNLSPLDNNNSTDIYIRDLQKGVTRLVSIDVNGNAAGRSRLPQVSSDGQVIAFESGSPKLVAHDTNGFDDDFVRDRVSKTTERVSVNGAGVQANGDRFSVQRSPAAAALLPSRLRPTTCPMWTPTGVASSFTTARPARRN